MISKSILPNFNLTILFVLLEPKEIFKYLNQGVNKLVEHHFTLKSQIGLRITALKHTKNRDIENTTMIADLHSMSLPLSPNVEVQLIGADSTNTDKAKKTTTVKVYYLLMTIQTMICFYHNRERIPFVKTTTVKEYFMKFSFIYKIKYLLLTLGQINYLNEHKW